MDNIDKMLDKLGIPKEPPKGSFYDFTSDEEQAVNEQPKKKRGAPRGNQNARKHGLYSKLIPANDPDKYHRAAETDDLSNEIAFLRLKLDSLFNDPDADLNQILQVLTILGRLVNIQRRYTWRWPAYRPELDEQPNPSSIPPESPPKSIPSEKSFQTIQSESPPSQA